MLLLYLLRLGAVFASLGPTQPTNQTRPGRSAHGTLKFTYDTNITRVTFDNPPINLFNVNFGADLLDFMLSIQPNPSVNSSTPPPKIVIFDSSDPEIFASHFDLNGVLNPDLGNTLFHQLYSIVELVRNTTTVVFISEVNGLATGFGNEFMVQTDIRFAGPRTRASQLESAGGLFAGAGGQQAVTRLVNRGRGLQYLLASQAIDGPTGARTGWFNEYFDNATGLRSAVDTLAQRIALFPVDVIQATKGGLVELYPSLEVYKRDMENLMLLASAPEEQVVVRRILELGQNQSRNEFELGLPDTLLQLWQ